MLASNPANMVNQKQADLGIPNRFKLTPSRFKTPEQEYWRHVGYQAALRDVLNVMRELYGTVRP
jgi:hypothetical protein